MIKKSVFSSIYNILDVLDNFLFFFFLGWENPLWDDLKLQHDSALYGGLLPF